MQGLEFEIKAGMVIMLFPQDQRGATSVNANNIDWVFGQNKVWFPVELKKAIIFLSCYAVAQV